MTEETTVVFVPLAVVMVVMIVCVFSPETSPGPILKLEFVSFLLDTMGGATSYRMPKLLAPRVVKRRRVTQVIETKRRNRRSS